MEEVRMLKQAWPALLISTLVVVGIATAGRLATSDDRAGNPMGKRKNAPPFYGDYWVVDPRDIYEIG